MEPDEVRAKLNASLLMLPSCFVISIDFGRQTGAGLDRNTHTITTFTFAFLSFFTALPLLRLLFSYLTSQTFVLTLLSFQCV